MNRFTIYCTEEQTKRALELGAPIFTAPYFSQVLYEIHNFFVKDETAYYFPTAEQMICWLEKKGILISITACNTPDNPIYNYSINRGEESWSTFSTRKEATLAAIDAALDYLIQLKE